MSGAADITAAGGPPLGKAPADAQPAERDKWLFLESAWIQDARDPGVVGVSRALWAASGGSRRAFLKLAMAYVRDVVRYVSDTERTGGEHIPGWNAPREPMLAQLGRGDDCDGKTRLFVALVKAVRNGAVGARMVGRWSGGRLTHVSAVAFVENDAYPVELTLKRAQLGELGEQVPREASGDWLR